MERVRPRAGSCKSKPLPLGSVNVTVSVNTKLMEHAKKMTSDEMGQWAIVQIFMQRYLGRHSSGDWGNLSEHDQQVNIDALDSSDPKRVMSVYDGVEYIEGVPTDDRMYVITEWDRSVTTLLFPDDY